jgi:hypothetical protein
MEAAEAAAEAEAKEHSGIKAEKSRFRAKRKKTLLTDGMDLDLSEGTCYTMIGLEETRRACPVSRRFAKIEPRDTEDPETETATEKKARKMMPPRTNWDTGIDNELAMLEYAETHHLKCPARVKHTVPDAEDEKGSRPRASTSRNLLIAVRNTEKMLSPQQSVQKKEAYNDLKNLSKPPVPGDAKAIVAHAQEVFDCTGRYTRDLSQRTGGKFKPPSIHCITAMCMFEYFKSPEHERDGPHEIVERVSRPWIFDNYACAFKALGHDLKLDELGKAQTLIRWLQQEKETDHKAALAEAAPASATTEPVEAEHKDVLVAPQAAIVESPADPFEVADRIAGFMEQTSKESCEKVSEAGHDGLRAIIIKAGGVASLYEAHLHDDFHVPRKVGVACLLVFLQLIGDIQDEKSFNVALNQAHAEIHDDNDACSRTAIYQYYVKLVAQKREILDRIALLRYEMKKIFTAFQLEL